MKYVIVSDIVEDNGKTIKQNNLTIVHEIPIGSLVEIQDEGNEEQINGLRLFVVNHSRDCDGTPLYDLSFKINAQKEYNDIEADKSALIKAGLYTALNWQANGSLMRHYGQESLTIIRLPK
jgi:hypothetical protein